MLVDHNFVCGICKLKPTPTSYSFRKTLGSWVYICVMKVVVGDRYDMPGVGNVIVGDRYDM